MADEFELQPGTLLGPAALARPILHRATRELGSALFLGLVYGLIGLGLAVGGLLTAIVPWPGVGLKLLAVVELALAAVLLWVALAVLRDLLADRRFNRRQIVVRFGLDDIEIRSTDGLERVALTDAATHPLLRTLAIDGRIRAILHVRAACRRLAPDDERRLILEALALETFDPVSHSDDPPRDPPPLYAAAIAGRVALAHDPAELADVPHWRVATGWDPDERVFLPRLDPSALTRPTSSPRRGPRAPP